MEHEHHHPHGPDAHAPIEEHAHYRPDSLLLEQALRELLIENNVFTAADLQQQIENLESLNPGLGAKVVARAWVDAGFKARLLADAKAAVTELGIDVANAPELKVVENTPAVHHMIVCTLCSCYPRNLLGLPPAWYKSFAYRSRVVSEPRAVLAEFGLILADGVSVRVHDSTADLRYLVIPMRPEGTEQMGEAELAALVTRDSMIGVAQARRPTLA